MTPFLGPNHPEVRVVGQQIVGVEQYLSGYHANVGERFNAMGGAELGPLLTSMLTRSVEQARQHEGLLRRSFEGARDRAALHSGRLMQIATLERELERLDHQYDQLFTKSNNIDPQQIQAPIRASIVQEPLPALKPASPRLAVTYLGALAAGLIVGCLAVYVQDLLDDRFGSPEEMSQRLGLPVLSIIRRFEAIAGEQLDAVHAFAGVDSTQGEAFRTLRTALTIGNESADRLAVSSAEPSDGKTTVCVNLAVSVRPGRQADAHHRRRPPQARHDDAIESEGQARSNRSVDGRRRPSRCRRALRAVDDARGARCYPRRPAASRRGGAAFGIELRRVALVGGREL